MSSAPGTERLSLARNEVHVWQMRGSDTPDECDRLAVLDDAERTRAARFRSDGDRRGYVGAHWLLRTALSRYGSVPPHAWRFCVEPGGRPVLANGQAADLYFSLSHAGGAALVAIARVAAVGIDLEVAESLQRMPEIAPRFLHAAELDIWQARPAAEADRFALTLWTLKEAYAKALGRGLELDFRRVRFSNCSGAWHLAEMPESEPEPLSWHCETFAPWPGAQAALVAAMGPGQSLNWRLIPAAA